MYERSLRGMETSSYVTWCAWYCVRHHPFVENFKHETLCRKLSFGVALLIFLQLVHIYRPDTLYFKAFSLLQLLLKGTTLHVQGSIDPLSLFCIRDKLQDIGIDRARWDRSICDVVCSRFVIECCGSIDHEGGSIYLCIFVNGPY